VWGWAPIWSPALLAAFWHACQTVLVLIGRSALWRWLPGEPDLGSLPYAVPMLTKLLEQLKTKHHVPVFAPLVASDVNHLRLLSTYLNFRCTASLLRAPVA
jgi:hypothetical protein